MVFTKSTTMKSRFLLALKAYSINSFFFNLNDVLIFVLYFSMNSTTWRLGLTDYYANSTFTFVYVYCILTIWTIVYTFGGILFFYFTLLFFVRLS